MLLHEYVTQQQTAQSTGNEFNQLIRERPYLTSAPGATEDMPIAGKLGLCGQKITADVVQNVSGDLVSWWYNYYIWIPIEDQITWANANNI